MMSSSPTTTSSSISAAHRAKPAKSRARSRRAAIPSRVPAHASIRRHRRSSPTDRRCSRKPLRRWVTSPSRSHRETCHRHIPTRSESRSGLVRICGFCEWFGCGNYSKASPQTAILPVLVRYPNFEARTQCEVLKINLDKSGKRATGVTYIDTSGNEWEQPADLVLLCAFQLFNVQLLLLSGIGKPYDPNTGEGVTGRNYSYQVTSSVDAFFDNKIFNPFIASGSIGMCIDEFNGDNFDHGPHGFVGGGYLGAVQTNGRPLQSTRVPKGTPRWGLEWKQAVAKNYLTSYQAVTHGGCCSYRDAYCDLDPTYTDRFGRKLMRITFDFHENELKMSQYLTDRLAEVAQKMGPRQFEKKPRTGPYDITVYQTTHTCGGAIMGADLINFRPSA